VVIIDGRRVVPLFAVLTAVVLTGCTAGAGAAPVSETTASSDPAPVPSTPSAQIPITTDSPAGTVTPEQLPVDPVFTERVVQLAPGAIDEASGIAASQGNPGAYFLIDDDRDVVFAVASDGSVLATIGVDGMYRAHAESISGANCGSTPLPDDSSADRCLYIGGVGDNEAVREDVVVYRIAEPDLADPPTEPVPADEWRYTYPDGAHDSDAMMVDSDGSIVIVTKPYEGKSPTGIYRGAPGGGELTLVREFTPPRPVIPLRTFFTGNVAVDVAAEPGRVLLLTYDELQEFTAPDPAADITDFPDWPHHRLPMPSMPQAEGVSGEVEGCGYVVASEAGPGGDRGSLAFIGCS